MDEKCMEFTEGSGNVFADLGLPNPEERLLKSELSIVIARMIEGRGLTQAQAAELLGINQPWVSNLLRGRLSMFFVERLLRFLLALEADIEIVVKEHRGSTGTGRVAVRAS